MSMHVPQHVQHGATIPWQMPEQACIHHVTDFLTEKNHCDSVGKKCKHTYNMHMAACVPWSCTLRPTLTVYL